jgi:Kef-type K+ transport system membrane component KefB
MNVPSVIALGVVLAAARAGGLVADRLRQPRVLGELAAGLLLGNLALTGFSSLDFLKTNPALAFASGVAVIVLLFHASMESTVGEMRKIGVAALLIAVCGAAGSFCATLAAAWWLLPASTPFARAFVAASLGATSVGVTARVFRDLGRARTRTAHLILAAAVADDVIALVALAAMTAAGSIPVVLGKAIAFLVGGLAIGMFVAPRLLSLASRSMAIVLLAAAFAFCFAMAWLASLAGLAPVVGAFAAGLAIEEWHYKDFIDRHERTLDDLITPVASWITPVFFVVIGIHTDLSALARPGVIALAAALTVAACAGKLFCAFGVVGGHKTVDRMAVALGMLPRGEVTLIFANLGATMGLVGADTLLALVLTVIATMMITPAALTWRLARTQ